MSEKTIAEAIQDTIQSMDGINPASVTIADWNVLDGSTDNSPFIRIDIAEDFESNMDGSYPIQEWQIPVTLLVAFDSWDETYLDFRDIRQRIINVFNEIGTNRSAGGIEGVNITTIRSTTAIEPVLPEYSDFDTADPVFLSQVMIFEVEEME
jgi:hypothetical protein